MVHQQQCIHLTVPNPVEILDTDGEEEDCTIGTVSNTANDGAQQAAKLPSR
jgi:hypothetical protein